MPLCRSEADVKHNSKAQFTWVVYEFKLVKFVFTIQ